jgi:hypothetical protein
MKMPLAQAQSQTKPRTRIVVLGTKGGPRVEMGRSNPANLLRDACERDVSPRWKQKNNRASDYERSYFTR